MTERILKYPGFLYEIDGRYYFLGKWICSECTDVDAQDCVYMYHMSRREHEEAGANFYFQKIRAYSDFALEVPYNPAKIRSDMEALLGALPKSQEESLKRQLSFFEEDYPKFCGGELRTGSD